MDEILQPEKPGNDDSPDSNKRCGFLGFKVEDLVHPQDMDFRVHAPYESLATPHGSAEAGHQTALEREDRHFAEPSGTSNRAQPEKWPGPV